LDDIKQTRTGISKAASGLDADALQSTTKAAVSATVNAAHQHIEMIARIFAETGLRKLFTGILKLVTENQDQARMVRLRNVFIPIDPRSWDSNMDVIVNVGVGEGTMEERVALLTQVAARQEQIIGQQGPSNPVVTIPQYTNTLAKMLQLAGIKDSQNYFAQLPIDWQPPESPPPKPTPEETLAKVQAESIQADIQKKAAELQLDREKAIMSDDRERDRIEQDGILRRYELELKYGVQIQSAEIDFAMNREREMINQQAAMSQQVPMDQQMGQPMEQEMAPPMDQSMDYGMGQQPQQPQPMM
jgi:hypothetical protein